MEFKEFPVTSNTFKECKRDEVFFEKFIEGAKALCPEWEIVSIRNILTDEVFISKKQLTT